MPKNVKEKHQLANNQKKTVGNKQMISTSKENVPSDQDPSRGDVQNSLSSMSKIIFAIKENNEYKALQAVNEQIAKGMPGILPDPVSEWRYYLSGLLTQIILMTSQEGRYTAFLKSRARQAMVTIDSCHTIQDCQDLFITIVNEVFRLRIETGHQYPLPVQLVMEMVSADLKQPLTLNYFAEKLNVNNCYLSDLFRRSTGITLTEYVLQKRLAHALTLLEFTRTPIKEIAREVGIPNFSYFTKLFKSRMSMPPVQYREEADRKRLEYWKTQAEESQEGPQESNKCSRFSATV